MPAENPSAHVAQSSASLYEELHSGTRPYGEYHSCVLLSSLPYRPSFALHMYMLCAFVIWNGLIHLSEKDKIMELKFKVTTPFLLNSPSRI